ncbi:MAG: class B sortase [Anaerotignum sp.]|nr:class B sortase [Anaerotignum sp.]
MKLKILTVIFLLLFLSSTAYLVDTQVEYLISDRINAQMNEKVQEFSSEVSNGTEEKEFEILPKFSELYEENQEFTGWIKIEGTEIDYPVMKPTEDNDFYLNHSPDGNYNQYGAIYFDVSSDLKNPSTNWILYGHNFRDGSMFGSLKKYKNESYYQEHPIIKLDTLYEEGEYEIISVFTSQVFRKDQDVFKYYQYTNIQSKEKFDEYISNIEKLSLYEIDETAEFGDSLITLSTCDEWTENGRIAVVAKKITSE